MALAGAAYRSAFSSNCRVWVCAGLTLGKLNAVRWRGDEAGVDTVRQPAISASKSGDSSATFVICDNFLIIQILPFSKRTCRQLALKTNHLQVAAWKRQ